MEFKLCYKSYAFKPTIKAMKQFKEATGLDLWATLSRYMLTFIENREKPVGELVASLSDVVDFVSASQLLHALAQAENGKIGIDEIQDAMFHAGIFPNDSESDFAEPYPFVMYQVSIMIQEYHAQLQTEKKREAGL